MESSRPRHEARFPRHVRLDQVSMSVIAAAAHRGETRVIVVNGSGFKVDGCTALLGFDCSVFIIIHDVCCFLVLDATSRGKTE